MTTGKVNITGSRVFNCQKYNPGRRFRSGKLIVIDGIDGSGKATQTALLAKRLRQEGWLVKKIDFPRYEENFFGKLLGQCLAGVFGDFTKVDPHFASVLYAADRFETAGKIRQWLAGGYTVLADRYVSANQIHQGAKIRDYRKRKKFLKWLEIMEYKIFSLPYPDLVIYLDVPHNVSRRWLRQKAAQRKKRYLRGRRDVVENNLAYLRQARANALYLARVNKNWRKIICCRGSFCLSPEKIHEKVLGLVKKSLA